MYLHWRKWCLLICNKHPSSIFRPLSPACWSNPWTYSIPRQNPQGKLSELAEYRQGSTCRLGVCPSSSLAHLFVWRLWAVQGSQRSNFHLWSTRRQTGYEHRCNTKNALIDAAADKLKLRLLAHKRPWKRLRRLAYTFRDFEHPSDNTICQSQTKYYWSRPAWLETRDGFWVLLLCRLDLQRRHWHSALPLHCGPERHYFYGTTGI